jgi:hypothetical protein
MAITHEGRCRRVVVMGSESLRRWSVQQMVRSEDDPARNDESFPATWLKTRIDR